MLHCIPQTRQRMIQLLISFLRFVQFREDELRKVITQLQAQVLSMGASAEQSSSQTDEQVTNLQEQFTILSHDRDKAVTKLQEA